MNIKYAFLIALLGLTSLASTAFDITGGAERKAIQTVQIMQQIKNLQEKIKEIKKNWPETNQIQQLRTTITSLQKPLTDIENIINTAYQETRKDSAFQTLSKEQREGHINELLKKQNQPALQALRQQQETLRSTLAQKIQPHQEQLHQLTLTYRKKELATPEIQQLQKQIKDLMRSLRGGS